VTSFFASRDSSGKGEYCNLDAQIEIFFQFANEAPAIVVRLFRLLLLFRLGDTLKKQQVLDERR
jgi:predicted nucleic acid-binding OB-fold protein